jgi:thiol-disulfide isomerase/thioredoxin
MSAPEIPSLHSKAEYLRAVMYEGVTILEGTATWCQQCKVIAPEVAKMVGEYPNVGKATPLSPNLSQTRYDVLMIVSLTVM